MLSSTKRLNVKSSLARRGSRWMISRTSCKPLRPTRDVILGKERVLCLDAVTGKVVWKHEHDRPYTIHYGSGPRTTPTVTGGRVYALGGIAKLQHLHTELDVHRPAWPPFKISFGGGLFQSLPHVPDFGRVCR